MAKIGKQMEVEESHHDTFLDSDEEEDLKRDMMNRRRDTLAKASRGASAPGKGGGGKGVSGEVENDEAGARVAGGDDAGKAPIGLDERVAQGGGGGGDRRWEGDGLFAIGGADVMAAGPSGCRVDGGPGTGAPAEKRLEGGESEVQDGPAKGSTTLQPPDGTGPQESRKRGPGRPPKHQTVAASGVARMSSLWEFPCLFGLTLQVSGVQLPCRWRVGPKS